MQSVHHYFFYFEREVRRLTTDEMQQYQAAVRALKEKNPSSGVSSWDEMRDEYMRRAPIAQV